MLRRGNRDRDIRVTPRAGESGSPFRQDRFALERMRILLDENTPRGVRRILSGHDVRTSPEMGWAGIANGQLLDEAEKAGFDALITSDQNFVFQQNLAGRNIAVVVLSTNTWP